MPVERQPPKAIDDKRHTPAYKLIRPQSTLSEPNPGVPAGKHRGRNRNRNKFRVGGHALRARHVAQTYDAKDTQDRFFLSQVEYALKFAREYTVIFRVALTTFYSCNQTRRAGLQRPL